MKLSKYAAGLICMLLSLTVMSGCSASGPAPTTPEETTVPTVAPTEDPRPGIKKDAFNGSDIQEYTVEEDVEYIGEGAFANCAELKDFFITLREVDIHENAFSGSGNVVFHCYLGSTADLFAREHGYERIYFDAFSLTCDTVNNGCVGLPITWSVVDVMPGQDIESQFVYIVNLNDEPVLTTEPTAETDVVFTPTEGGNYSLTVEIINELTQSSAVSETVPVADKLIMGYYEQDGDLETTTEPLEWRILTVEDGKALVITEKIINRGSYFNPEWIKYKYTYWANSCVAATRSINWWGSAPEAPERMMSGLTEESVPLAWYGERGPETELFYCHARYWCNTTFYGEAFSDLEKERILLSHLTNPDNPVHGVEGGPDSDDYVFFLSIEELDAYLPTRDDRVASFTTYAENLPLQYGERDAYYWLRTPGICQFNAMYVVAQYGVETHFGSDVGHNMVGYRPAMWITIGG